MTKQSSFNISDYSTQTIKDPSDLYLVNNQSMNSPVLGQIFNGQSRQGKVSFGSHQVKASIKLVRDAEPNKMFLVSAKLPTVPAQKPVDSVERIVALPVSPAKPIQSAPQEKPTAVVQPSAIPPEPVVAAAKIKSASVVKPVIAPAAKTSPAKPGMPERAEPVLRIVPADGKPVSPPNTLPRPATAKPTKPSKTTDAEIDAVVSDMRRQGLVDPFFDPEELYWAAREQKKESAPDPVIAKGERTITVVNRQGQRVAWKPETRRSARPLPPPGGAALPKLPAAYIQRVLNPNGQTAKKLTPEIVAKDRQTNSAFSGFLHAAREKLLELGTLIFHPWASYRAYKEHKRLQEIAEQPIPPNMKEFAQATQDWFRNKPTLVEERPKVAFRPFPRAAAVLGLLAIVGGVLRSAAQSSGPQARPERDIQANARQVQPPAAKEREKTETAPVTNTLPAQSARSTLNNFSNQPISIVSEGTRLRSVFSTRTSGSDVAIPFSRSSIAEPVRLDDKDGVLLKIQNPPAGGGFFSEQRILEIDN